MRKFEIVYSRDKDGGGRDREEIVADKCNVMQSGVIVFTVRANIIRVLSSSGFISITPGDQVEEIRGGDGRSVDIEIAK